jgi:polyhydroxyalkanoate synthase
VTDCDCVWGAEMKKSSQDQADTIPLEAATPAAATPAIDAILGANPFVGLNARSVARTIGTFVESLARRPEALAMRLSRLGLDWLQILAGSSDVAPDPSDRRFEDPTWSDNPVYRRMMQTYLAWRSTMRELAAGDANGDWKTTEQQRFLMALLTEALAPTNTLPGNPAALKRAFETGGLSLVRGLRNFVDDVWNNHGMPSQVDKRPFIVGKTIAATPGAVVYRGELCEIIQYTPATGQVYERPLLLVPPQINKFYIMDLAPKRSLTEYAVAHGVQFFTVSWRNPTPANSDWGLDQYVSACKEAVAAVCDISASPDCNLIAVCAGGITSTLLLGHLAASGDRRVNAATLLVTMLDSSVPSMTGMFATEETVAAAVQRSRKRGVLDGADMARLFAWLRPNDLVWSYWVNNYLMGREPAAFDILFWNNDSTSLPANLHAGFLDIMLHNSLMKADAVRVLGTPVSLKRVDRDMYIVGGMTDHICSWRACYGSARLFGGQSEFVLNSSGHVQTLVCPPNNPKAKYFTNQELVEDPDKWLAAATERKGSWWDHWLEWLESRSRGKRPAPAILGSDRFPPLEPAPGRYVHESR